jgi:hypothetical protein
MCHGELLPTVASLAEASRSRWRPAPSATDALTTTKGGLLPSVSPAALRGTAEHANLNAGLPPGGRDGLLPDFSYLGFELKWWRLGWPGRPWIDAAYR